MKYQNWQNKSKGGTKISEIGKQKIKLPQFLQNLPQTLSVPFLMCAPSKSSHITHKGKKCKEQEYHETPLPTQLI